MNSEKLLILGAGGQVGRELKEIYPEATCLYHNSNGSDSIELSDQHDIIQKISKTKPKVIINAAALANVDLCERNKALAYSVNGYSLLSITKIARKLGSSLYHISTDYVFDGIDGNYSENSTPNPINYYGISKLLGDAFASSYDKSAIIRTSGVFGHSNNFPIFVVNTLKSNKQVNAIKGYYSPIHAKILAKAIKDIIDAEFYGVINVAADRISRYEFALRLANKFNLDRSLISEIESPANMFAKRPFDSSLDISLAKTLLHFDFHSIDVNIDALYSSLSIS
jgi:dTDP-4-dehydrorhamnose reductase